MKRATYEISFSPTTAAFARFGRALVECDAQLLCSYSMPGGGSVVASIKVAPEKAPRLSDVVKPIDFRYRSPTVFDNGSLIPIYASAADELEDKWTARALATQRLREDQ